MTKISIRQTTFVIVIASLTTLTIISSCVTSTSSFPDSGEMKVVRQIFPSAIDIAEMQISQGAQLSGRPDNLRISEIKGSSGILGYSVHLQVVSRSCPFTIFVVLDQELCVKRATVLSYSATRGRGVLSSAFVHQFKGKCPADPIEIGRDIDAVTGATLSCRAMAKGVKNAIRIVKDSLEDGRFR